MFGIPKIKKLEELVSQYIDDTKKIVETRVSRHVFASEAPGSTVLIIDVVLKDETRYTQEILSVVAKLLPERKFFQRVFNSKVTFKNEVTFYKTVIPVLESFLKESGVKETLDYFPKFYGARLNLEGDCDRVDEDAVLILEEAKGKAKSYHTYSLSTAIVTI